MDRSRAAVMRILMTLAVGMTVAVVGMAAAGPEPSTDMLRRAYQQTRQAREKTYPQVPRNDDVAALIAWGEAGYLDTVLSMYEATGDAAYLGYFVKRARQVLDMRDSVTVDKDYPGHSYPLWPADGKYTLGQMILTDTGGSPALELETAASAYNNQTRVTLASEGKGKWRLSASNRMPKLEENWTLEPKVESVQEINEKSKLVRLYPEGWPTSGAALREVKPTTRSRSGSCAPAARSTTGWTGAAGRSRSRAAG